MACKMQYIFYTMLFLLQALSFVAKSQFVYDAMLQQRHEQWMALHGRVYQSSTEKDERYKIFKKNCEHIESFNKANNRPYKLAINQYADVTNEEFMALHTGFKGRANLAAVSRFKYENATKLPISIDWRMKGAVTPIKNQGGCDCCWAFSAVAAVEGINKLKTGMLISLSEQELVDCDTDMSGGCKGGYMFDAFDFISKNNGIATEADYPYKGIDGTCDLEKAAIHAAQITGYENVPQNEAALLKAVAFQPVSVAVDAEGPNFRFYSSGVFNMDCGTNLTHAVTIVGYGTTGDGTKYWLVKNSWGTGWGEQGYMRMQRDIDAVEGTCGIAMEASYPTA